MKEGGKESETNTLFPYATVTATVSSWNESPFVTNSEGIEEMCITCNDETITELFIDRCPRLKRIVIGDDSFGSVRLFRLGRLEVLESVIIGKRCFTFCKSYTDDCGRIDGCCSMEKCSALVSIQIGDYSFADYGTYDCANLPSLQTMAIAEFCFPHAATFSLARLST